MKLIDLLNKIANGEEIPYKIKYNGRIYEYAEEIKWYLRDDLKNELTNSKKCLNDEVEIEDTPKVQVEMTEKEYNEYLDSKLDISKEDKKIEEICLSELYGIKFNEAKYTICAKINEIINKINKGE